MATDEYKKVTESRKSIILNNFLGGISWGLGATIGTALILAIVGFVLSRAQVLPVVGNIATYLSDYIDTHKTTLPK